MRRLAHTRMAWLGCGMLLMTAGCQGGYRRIVSPVHLTLQQETGFQHTNSTGRWGGAFVMATIADPRTFNPITTQETSSSIAWGPIFSPLITRDVETLQVKPRLAQSWTNSADGRVWTFHLRRGIRWSDGKPLTAQDVIFTLNVIYDTKVNAPMRSLLEQNGQPYVYKAVGRHTFVITLPKPSGSFLSAFAGVVVIPKHILEPVWRAGKFNSAWGVGTPVSKLVGDGPFLLAQYSSGESLTYVRNPYYWRLAANGRQLPFLDGGVIEIVPDINTMVLKFMARETDAVTPRAEDWQPLQALKKNGHFKLFNMGPDWGNSFLEFNQNPKSPLPGYMVKWFSDVRFRQAVSYAIDRQAIVTSVLRGFGVPLWGYISPANKVFYDPEVPQYPYSPAKALALLQQMGFQKKNGILTDAQGHPLEFTLETNAGNNQRAQICDIVQADLNAIGMKVTLSFQDFNSIIGSLEGSHNWQCIMLGFTGGYDPHNASAIWLHNGSLHDWNPNHKNPATPWEAEIDQIFNQAAQTVSRAKRVQLYRQFQQTASTQLPLVYLVEPDVLAAVRDTVHNNRPSALVGALYPLDEIWKSQ